MAETTSVIIRTAGQDDLPRLQSVYRRSSLSNEGDREALLQRPEYLVLPGEAAFRPGCFASRGSSPLGVVSR
jgi:hypothetical protein